MCNDLVVSVLLSHHLFISDLSVMGTRKADTESNTVRYSSVTLLTQSWRSGQERLE